MNCPECGQEGRSKFCTHCGAPILRLVSQTHETAHFRIHCPAGSFAGQNLPSIEQRLESCYAVASAMLDVGLRSGLVDVYLSELVVHHQGYGLSSAGYAVPSRMQIHDVYRTDAPGESLERSLVTLLLALIVENERPVTPALVDGVLALAVERHGVAAAGDKPADTLVDLVDDGALPSISTLLVKAGGDTPHDARGTRLAASIDLMRFLLARFGVERWKGFVRLLQTTNPQQAARVALGRRLEQLDSDWAADIRRRARVDVAAFLPSLRSVAPPPVGGVIELLTSGVLSGLAAILGARALGTALEQSVLVHDRPKLYAALAVLAGCVIFLLVASVRQALVATRGAERVREALYRRALGGGLSPVGAEVSRVVDEIDAVQSAYRAALAPGLPATAALATVLLGMVILSWKLSLLAVMVLPLLLVCCMGLQEYRAGAAASRRVSRTADAAALWEASRTTPLLRSMGMKKAARDRLTGMLGASAAHWVRSQRLGWIYRVVPPIVAALWLLATVSVGLWLTAGRGLHLDTLVGCLVLAGTGLGYAWLLLDVLERLIDGAEELGRVQRAVIDAPAVQEEANPRHLPAIVRGVRLEAVSVEARAGGPPLRNLNMSFPAGATVAIVGDAGCGASCIVDLFLRLRDPDEGRITFDGADVREVRLDDLSRQIGIATADDVLVGGTIGETVRLAHPRATDSGVEFAARLAGAHQNIAALPRGYDTPVEDGGAHLPLLLRRRLNLARALLGNPSVLVADRIGDGLDPAAETQLYGALKRAGHERLTLIITSRVTAAAHTDRIYVMDRGRVVEQGTHDDLVRRDTLYARLWREQESDATVAGAARERAMLLECVPIFATLSPHLRALVAEQLELQRIGPGELIAGEGDITDQLVLIRSGMVEVAASDPLLRGKALAHLYRGDHCGEMALLHDGLRAAKLRAGTEVELYSLRRVDFLRLLRRAPELEDRLRSVMAERTQVSTRKEMEHLSVSQTVRLPQRAAS